MARSIRNACLWVFCLICGVVVGAVMLPAEAVIMLVAWCFGAKDVTWRDFGFCLRQFTDIRSLHVMYPITAKHRQQAGEGD